MPVRRASCGTPGCDQVLEKGRCQKCAPRTELRRGSARERGYRTPGHRAFRAAVLRRDPICVVCRVAVSTVADHYPRSRRELVAAGLNPNDPRYGRGLCEPDHNRQTSIHQPGGWNAR